ncbi:hypothetical protein BS47DRAFT_1358588 [Hydnum rufescens UP504]|uniref:Uncharacterized protein n=1 Tax=Hydnum rufescens UP504 TaxID=1448309 RepID=A0A9P6B732_9AGAM|nr:hypothetical protein BS47DRAFT_1358588 [Hydnum rufescens UP504]
MRDPRDHGYRNRTGGPQSLPHPRGPSSTSYWPAPHPQPASTSVRRYGRSMPIVQRGRGALVPELSARHSEGQGSSQGQGNYQRQGGPFGDRGLQGRGGPMPVHPAGRGHGSWASAVSGSAANVLVPQQQVAAQATPYDPVIIGRLLNALSGPAPNVLMPQPQAAVSGMLYSPIPVGRWAIISLGPVPEGFQTPDVWLALYPQVIAARTECKKGKVSIQLLFKRSRPRDELKTVTIDASHAPSEHYTGLRDLEYIDQPAGTGQSFGYGKYFPQSYYQYPSQRNTQIGQSPTHTYRGTRLRSPHQVRTNILTLAGPAMPAPNVAHPKLIEISHLHQMEMMIRGQLPQVASSPIMG